MYYYMDMAFPSENDVPDFGSIKLYYIGEPVHGYQNHGTKKIRGYTLLSDDIPKLDLVTNAADGSEALVIDTGKVYIFCANQWHEWTGNGNKDTTLRWSHF